MSRRFVIGSRGSALALWQARAVEDAVKVAAPDVETEIRVISTKGDRILDKPLEKIGDKGLFTKDLEQALLHGEVDVCVHSMKDVPADLPPGCSLAAMLPRADVRDVLVCGPRVAMFRCLDELPAGTRLGTGSLRRTAQLRAGYPQVEPLPIRGNVDTRLAKAQGGDYDGVILAAAGVQRMGMAGRIACFLPIERMLPAVGQGAIGLESRTGDAASTGICALVNDEVTFACVMAERHVLAALEGGCQVPLGAYARYEAGILRFDAAVFSLDGTREARASRTWDVAPNPEDAAREMVAELRRRGAYDILREIREEGGA